MKKELKFDYLYLPIQNELKEYLIQKTEVAREDNLLIGIEGITDEDEDFV